jgi:hypothetical protein
MVQLVYALSAAPSFLLNIIQIPAVDKNLDGIDFKFLLRNMTYTFSCH